MTKKGLDAYGKMYILLYEDFQNWLDKSANLITFVGLLVGIAGVILTVYLYRKQKRDMIAPTEVKEQPELDAPILGVYLKVNHTSRRLTGYGASEGDIIQAGHFKGNYEVEAELTVTIQNESPNTIYTVEVSYIPNQYSKIYSLVDTRDKKIQPLEGNKYFEFKLRIKNEYYDMYAQDVDKEFSSIYMVGKGVSPLNGSKICIKYKDSKHREHTKVEEIM